MRKKSDTKDIIDYNAQIKKLRESLGMTQGQLAEKVDRTSRAIRQIENGEAFPRISTLQRIADALNAHLTISLVPKTDIIQSVNEEVQGEVEAMEFPANNGNDFRIGEND